MAKKKTTKKTAKKKPAVSTLSAKLEKTIEKDFQACEELLRTGAGRNEWVEKNCKRMKSWQEAAEAGDARGQVLYGLCFYYGHGVEEDLKKAVEWFTKSAEQGNAQGQFSLGQCFYYAHGVKEDHKKAVKWFARSAEQENAQGQFSLGQCYNNGQGVKEDEEKAVEWFTKSAEQENAQGQFSLGQCYKNSWGVKEDLKKAVEWFTASAEQGNIQGQFSLGQCFYFGQGVEEDHAIAVQWFEKSAKQGNAEARVNLDEYYQRKLQQPGEELTGDDYRLSSEYLAGCDDGEDAYLELDVKTISNEAAQLLSNWRPIGESMVVIFLGIESLSDGAAEILSQWDGSSLGWGELQLTSLSDISTKGATFLLNTPIGLRVNINLLPGNIKEILMQRPVEEDMGGGKLILSPIQ